MPEGTGRQGRRNLRLSAARAAGVSLALANRLCEAAAAPPGAPDNTAAYQALWRAVAAVEPDGARRQFSWRGGAAHFWIIVLPPGGAS